MKEPYRETVIYIRTSTKDQNPLNQLADCESIRPKDQKTDTFVDYMLLEDKQSAWNDYKERPQYNKLVAMITSRKLKNIIVWDLDRIYRKMNKLKGFFELCKAYKVTVHSYRQKWLEDINRIPKPFDEIVSDMLIKIFGWIAEEESQKKSDRVKLAVRKTDGVTKSYKGNKWGRKQISTQKKNIITRMRKEGFTVRKISEQVGLSVGVVHKYLTHANTVKTIIEPSS